MLFNKSTLIAVITAAVASVIAAPSAVPTVIGPGVALHFDPNQLPAGFIPCGSCPPPTQFTLPIALSSTAYNGSDACCSTFTITYNGQSVQGTYAYTSSNLAKTTNLALDNDLFAKFADPNTTFALYPVTYQLQIVVA